MDPAHRAGNPHGAAHLRFAPGRYIAPVRREDRITTDPGQCGGAPRRRGMRIRVSEAQILRDFPGLEPEGIEAARQHGAA